VKVPVFVGASVSAPLPLIEPADQWVLRHCRRYGNEYPSS
jgi:hypothetical protein